VKRFKACDARQEVRMFEPFAVHVYRRHLKGETVEQLSADLGITPERIRIRLRAAAEYLARQSRHAA
jgi:hypothetical protein